MKFFKILVISTIAISSLAGCQKKLDIEPEQSVSDNAVFTTKQGAQAALNGVYSTAQLLNTFGAGPQTMSVFSSR